MVYNYRLPTLFALISSTAVLLAVYTRLWPQRPLIAAIATFAVVSVGAIYVDFRRNGTGSLGALVGGLLGGLLAVILHLAASYLMLGFFEDEGVGVVGTLIILFMFGTSSGIFISGTIWAVVATALVMTRWKMNRRRNRDGSS